MKRNKVPPTVSLQYFIYEVKKQEQKEKKIKYMNGNTNEVLQIKNLDV